MLVGDPTRVLVTSSRMPFAVDVIRKLGEAGHEVFASDTFSLAPGSHSKYVVADLTTPSPNEDPDAFVDVLREFVDDHGIELLLPCFEEVFYLAQRPDRLGNGVAVFASDLAILTRLHHKAEFAALCHEIGLDVPPTVVVEDRDELRAATRALGRFFARPSFSRGGVDLYTNSGSLAGQLTLDDCSPTPKNPWIVQPFVEGHDVCTASVAVRGRVAAHATYVHPQTFEGTGGVTFESIEAPDVLRATQRIVEATGYHGQISFDFLRTEQGLVPIECNPRPTAGVTLMSTETFVEALRDDGRGPPRVVPPGVRRMIGAALVRDMLLHWSRLPSDASALVHGGKDIYAAPEDLGPGLYQILGYFHLRRVHRDADGRHQRSAAIDSYLHGICWNGGATA